MNRIAFIACIGFLSIHVTDLHRLREVRHAVHARHGDAERALIVKVGPAQEALDDHRNEAIRAFAGDGAY